jgi:hypothetical protein
MPGPAWTTILLYMPPCIAGITSTCYCAQSLVEMGCWEHFTWE